MRIVAITLSWAAIGVVGLPSTSLASSETSSQKVLSDIRADLASRKSANFGQMLGTWQKKHGKRAVSPLLEIARSSSAEDPDRYIALMGATKLGGSGVERDVLPFLKDRSWMLRTAALRALAAMSAKASDAPVLAMLKDPALVVRVEAATTVARLNPKGAVAGLIAAIRAPENYRQGKAQWVPQQAIRALVALRARDSADALKPLLARSRDPELQKLTIAALSSLTGKKLKPTAPLADQIAAWEAERL